MTAPLFRVPALPAGPSVTLAGDEGRHAAAVRRLRPGERVDLCDGEGGVAECVVQVAGRDRLELTVQARHQVPAPQPRLTVAQALVKGERSELAVELLTEVGVDEIVPWQAARCVARWNGERSVRRWAAAADAAAKQARRTHWPAIGEPAGLAELTDRVAAAGSAIVLDENASMPLASMPLDSVEAIAGPLLVVVGPEGGITDAELAALEVAGARRYRLGPTVLRASTAGTVAAGILSARSGRWSAPAAG